MIIFGITGPTGAGKTTILNAFANHDIEVIDCDKLYQEILHKDSNFRQEIITAFPNAVFPNGKINRERLADEVFNDEAKLIKLNWIVFPVISREIQKRIQQCDKIGIAIDAINLFESGISVLCNYTIGVVAPSEIRYKRIMKRDSISSKAAWDRINAQKDEEWYRKKCNYIINNNFIDKRIADVEIDKIVDEIIFYVFSSSPIRNSRVTSGEQILHSIIISAEHSYQVKLEKWTNADSKIDSNDIDEIQKDYIRAKSYLQACKDIARALFHWTEEDFQSIHGNI